MDLLERWGITMDYWIAAWGMTNHFMAILLDLVMTNSLLLKIVIEIADLPISMVMFDSFLYVYQRVMDMLILQ